MSYGSSSSQLTLTYNGWGNYPKGLNNDIDKHKEKNSL